VRRQLADEELKGGGLVATEAVIARRHRDLVEVGEERGLRRGEQAGVVGVRHAASLRAAGPKLSL
jgi:hypothetical protein